MSGIAKMLDEAKTTYADLVKLSSIEKKKKNTEQENIIDIYKKYHIKSDVKIGYKESLSYTELYDNFISKSEGNKKCFKYVEEQKCDIYEFNQMDSDKDEEQYYFNTCFANFICRSNNWFFKVNCYNTFDDVVDVEFKEIYNCQTEQLHSWSHYNPSEYEITCLFNMMKHATHEEYIGSVWKHLSDLPDKLIGAGFVTEYTKTDSIAPTFYIKVSVGSNVINIDNSENLLKFSKIVEYDYNDACNIMMYLNMPIDSCVYKNNDDWPSVVETLNRVISYINNEYGYFDTKFYNDKDLIGVFNKHLKTYKLDDTCKLTLDNNHELVRNIDVNNPSTTGVDIKNKIYCNWKCNIIFGRDYVVVDGESKRIAVSHNHEMYKFHLNMRDINNVVTTSISIEQVSKSESGNAVTKNTVMIEGDFHDCYEKLSSFLDSLHAIYR